MGPLAVASGLTVLVGLGLAALHESSEPGPGDTVFVPISSLPAGALPMFPAQAGSIALQVDGPGRLPGTLRGRITAYVIHEIPDLQVVPLPTPPGPIAVDNVPRAAVTSVWRGGKQV